MQGRSLFQTLYEAQPLAGELLSAAGCGEGKVGFFCFCFFLCFRGVFLSVLFISWVT